MSNKTRQFEVTVAVREIDGESKLGLAQETQRFPATKFSGGGASEFLRNLIQPLEAGVRLDISEEIASRGAAQRVARETTQAPAAERDPR